MNVFTVGLLTAFCDILIECEEKLGIAWQGQGLLPALPSLSYHNLSEI
jgi:hypothetical protein